jgi:hypothetical protein
LSISIAAPPVNGNELSLFHLCRKLVLIDSNGLTVIESGSFGAGSVAAQPANMADKANIANGLDDLQYWY